MINGDIPSGDALYTEQTSKKIIEYSWRERPRIVNFVWRFERARSIMFLWPHLMIFYSERILIIRNRITKVLNAVLIE